MLFKISENLLESKAFKTSRAKNHLRACLILRVPDLHTAPKRHLIKIRTFLKKIDFILKNIVSQLRHFEGLRVNQFLEILKSNKTPNKCSTNQLKL